MMKKPTAISFFFFMFSISFIVNHFASSSVVLYLMWAAILYFSCSWLRLVFVAFSQGPDAAMDYVNNRFTLDAVYFISWMIASFLELDHKTRADTFDQVRSLL
jgi:hypothetical protein